MAVIMDEQYDGRGPLAQHQETQQCEKGVISHEDRRVGHRPPAT